MNAAADDNVWVRSGLSDRTLSTQLGALLHAPVNDLAEIGTTPQGYPKHGQGYSGIVLERLRAVRTDLDGFTQEEQLVLMKHGWALADAVLRSYVLAGAPLPREGSFPATARRSRRRGSLGG